MTTDTPDATFDLGLPAPGGAERGGEFVLPPLPEPEGAGPTLPAAGGGSADGPGEREERQRASRRRRESRERWDPAARPGILRLLDLPLRWIPVALLAFAPLAWGSVEGWSGAVVVLGGCAVTVLWLARLLLFPGPCREERAARSHLASWSAGLHWPLAGLAAVGLLQLLPLGPLLASISPASAEAYRLAGPAATARVTLSAGATLRSLADLAALALLFLAVLDTLRGREEVRFLVAVVLLIGFAHAVGGILWHFAASGRAYWAAPAGGAGFGPYFNRNHFACLMGMVMPVGVGYLLSLGHRPAAPAAPGSAPGPGAGRDRGVRELRARQLLAGFAVAVMAGALSLSLSRGGIASTLVALAAFTLALGSGRRTRGRLLLLAAAFLAAAAFGAWLARGALAERLVGLGDVARDVSASKRLAIWGDTLRMAVDFPLLGTGFGTYGAALPRYQTATAGLGVEHAHNDWLQLLAEGGIAAALAAAALVAAYAGAALRLLRRRRDREAIFLAAGCLAGLAAFLLHALTDFNLHIPANALWFALIAATALKAAGSRA